MIRRALASVMFAVLMLAVPEVRAAAHLSAELRNTTAVGDMKHIIVTLTILNEGDEPAYVLRAAYSARQRGTTVRDQFDVMEACGRNAPYHAFTTDEDVLSEGDFQRIEPGGTFEQKLDLTGVYDIGPGGPVHLQYVVPLIRGSDGSVRAGRGMRESGDDVQETVASNTLVFLAPHVNYKSVWWP